MQVYIAGPMRGHDYYNFPAFDAAREWLVHMGWTAISPADLDRAMQGMEPDEYPPRDGYTGGFSRIDWHDVMRKDIRLILDRADALALLPGWESSSGANIERDVARALGLPIFDVPVEIVDEAPVPAEESDTTEVDLTRFGDPEPRTVSIPSPPRIPGMFHTGGPLRRDPRPTTRLPEDQA